MLIVILTGTVAFCTRAMISSLSSLRDVALVSLYFGFIEFVSRVTLQLRDSVGLMVVRCKKPIRTFFDDPKKMRFIADTIVTEMYFEMFGMFACICWCCVCVRCVSSCAVCVFVSY